MSAGEQAGAGRREVAYRVFAAEYDDADFEYTENEDDERSPNYVVTPTGARVNRLFAVGVLTEVERVNDEMLRGRVVDPTGAFVVYAGQYQPDPLTALERAEPPQFVAITGKTRTFQPEDADVTYTSIRPESINEVDADTRDRWTVTAARHTLDRVATFADALEREERGDELRSALEAAGVDSGLAAGIPLAIEHYGTTTAYLDAIREMAVEAAEVVAGEREEVEPPSIAPDDGGETAIAIDGETSFAAAGVESGEAATASEPAVPTSTAGESGTQSDAATETADEDGDAGAAAGGDPDAVEESTAATGIEAADEGGSDDDTDELGDFEPGSVGSGDDSEAIEEAGAEEPAAATDEIYEFDEDEREEIEAEFGTEFNTGSEIEEPGEADLDAPAPEDEEETTESEDEEETTESEDERVSEAEPEDEPEPETEKPEPADEGDAEGAGVDLEEAVVEAMRELDSGDGAERAAVVETVSDEHGASEDEVSDAIQDALMSGKCYEPGDGLLKSI
jgi:RPA family protein